MDLTPQRPGRIPPISSADVFSFLFISLFVVVGVAVLVWSIVNKEFNFFFALWCGMFIGIPCVIGYAEFKRFFRYGKFARGGDAIEAKVIRFVDDYSIQVNGHPVQDLCVRYWDEAANRPVEVEIDVNTTSEKPYPVGSTIWIYKLGDDYAVASKGYDKTLYHEDELMSGQFANNTSMTSGASVGTLHGITCPCCGSEIMIDEAWRPVDVISK